MGINPHPGSYRRGVPFSNSKMFWYLLNRAGLLDESESDLKGDASLKHIYNTKFAPKYALNFVNLVDRPTIDVTELKKGEEQAGVFPRFRATRTTTHVAILTKRSIAKAEGPKATTNVTHRSFDFADCACLLLNFLVLLHHSEVCTF